MTATLELTLDELARRSVLLAGTRHRSATDGTWCEPTTPHVPDCTGQPGEVGCDACWAAWQHAVATGDTA